MSETRGTLIVNYNEFKTESVVEPDDQELKKQKKNLKDIWIGYFEQHMISIFVTQLI